MFETTRSLAKLIYKVGMTILTLMLGVGAILALVNATTANGLGLVGGILAVLALIAGLSISKLDWQDRQGEAYRQLGRDIRHGINLSTSYTFNEPEVHRVDLATLEQAKRMASEGVPIDDICKVIDPGHDGHLPAHQEAFRRMVQAMIEQA
jgi:hypothetical protein